MIPSSRDIVLGRIRTSLGRERHADAGVQSRRTNWTRPAFAADDVARFIAKAEASFCTVERVATLGDAGAAIDAMLPARGLTPNVNIAPSLQHVSWPQTWATTFGAGRRVEAIAITDATAGIAETGTLVLCSQADRPSGLNFLPDLHICILRAEDIVHHLEDVWPKVRVLPVWPRAVNFISAPSRTADVAQIVVRPAHGPKALHIVLLGGPS